MKSSCSFCLSSQSCWNLQNGRTGTQSCLWSTFPSSVFLFPRAEHRTNSVSPIASVRIFGSPEWSWKAPFCDNSCWGSSWWDLCESEPELLTCGRNLSRCSFPLSWSSSVEESCFPGQSDWTCLKSEELLPSCYCFHFAFTWKLVASLGFVILRQLFISLSFFTCFSWFIYFHLLSRNRFGVAWALCIFILFLIYYLS